MKVQRMLQASFFLTLVSAGFVLAASADKAAKTTSYTALYVFGDSYSDIGARYLDGNGPTAVAYFAQSLGIPFTYPDDTEAGNKSLDFAATAATTGEDKGTGKWCCKGMMDQVNDFARRVHSGTLSFNPETTLFFLQGGLNDSNIPTDVTVENLTREIRLLQALGGRHFTLSLLSTKVPDFAKNAERLNPAYERLVAKLQKEGVDIRLNHWGSYLDEILEHPAHYGLVNTTSRCAGRALFKEDPTPCPNPDSYFYFHSGHPSTAVNKIVGGKLYQELAGAIPGKQKGATSHK